MGTGGTGRLKPVSANTATIARRFECIQPAGELLPGEHFDIAMRVIAPPAGAPVSGLAFYCLPGGMMDRVYFDLVLGVEDGPDDWRFSFAEAMARHGHVTITSDHPGLGESTCPGDEFALTPDLLTRSHIGAARAAIAALREGTLAPGLEAIPDVLPVGCGHSMGAVTIVDRQARDPFFAAMLLLGYGIGGLPANLSPELLASARDIDWLAANIAAIARERFGCARVLGKSRSKGAPPPGIDKAPAGVKVQERHADGPDFHTRAADPEGRVALRGAAAPLLTLPGLYSTFPGVNDRSRAQIDVPTLVVAGTHDFAHVGESLRATFPNAPDFEHFAPDDTGHNLFVFPSRTQTFARIAQWAARLQDMAGA